MQKTFTTALKNTYLAITNGEIYFTQPINIDIMKFLTSKGHYCSLSGGLYPIYNHTDCTLALYFKNDIQIKSFCPISVNNIASNFIVQLNPNQYLLAVIKRNPIEHRCPRNPENKYHFTPATNDKSPQRFTIYSTDLFIPAVNSFLPNCP